MRVMLRLWLTLVVILSAASASEVVTLRVAQAEEASTLSLYALVPPHEDNWRLAVSIALEGSAWGTGSQRSLIDVEDTAHHFEFRRVPRGSFYVVATVFGRDGRIRGQAETRLQR